MHLLESGRTAERRNAGPSRAGLSQASMGSLDATTATVGQPEVCFPVRLGIDVLARGGSTGWQF